MARDYAKVSPRFWTGDTGKKLRSNRAAQVLATYLISAPGSSMTGIYYLPLPIISHETGMTMGEVIEALTFLAGIDFAHYDGEDELVWVPAMAAWQIDDSLKPDDNRVKGIRKELASFRGHEFVGQFWERYGEAFSLGPKPLTRVVATPSKALPSQEQDQEQEQDQSLSPPSDPIPLPSSPPERAIPVLPGATVVIAPAPPAPWHANDWYRKFGIAWTSVYGVSHGGGTQTAKAIRDLGDILDELPGPERAQAERDAPELFAKYLAGGSPVCRERKHPFAWFVPEFSALRARPAARAGPKDVRSGTVRAEDCDHTASGRQEL